MLDLAYSEGLRASLRRRCPLSTEDECRDFARQLDVAPYPWLLVAVAMSARLGYGEDHRLYPLTLTALHATLQTQEVADDAVQDT